MIQTLIKNWWLLALCGVLDAIYSVTNLFMQGPDGSSLTLRTFAVRGTVVQMGMLALAAAGCTMAAGIWRSGKGRSWLLVLNGLALGAFGVIMVFSTGRHAFRSVALLLAVMALSIGLLALMIAPTLRRHVADEWLLGSAGVFSIGFAVAFSVMAFFWTAAGRPETVFLWLGSYFGFTAICMLALALRLNSLRMAVHRMAAG